MKYSHVIFDLDGTLCDPGLGITESVAYSLNKLGIVETDPKKLRKFVGPPLQHSFKEFYDMDDKTTEEAIRIYRERFKNKGIFEYKLYAGMEKLLSQLKHYKITLSVATSKIEPFALQILSSQNILDYFSFISADEPGKPKLKTQTIRSVLNNFNKTNRSNFIMVGDKEHDIIGANENGIDSIGVLYGYGTKEDLVNHHAKYIAKDVSNLSKILLGS